MITPEQRKQILQSLGDEKGVLYASFINSITAGIAANLNPVTISAELICNSADGLLLEFAKRMGQITVNASSLEPTQSESNPSN